MNNTESLAQLSLRVERELRMTSFPHTDWVPPKSGDSRADLEVLIVGAGQCGLAAGLGLAQKGVKRIQLVDAMPEGRQGPWATYARMKTLRSNTRHSGPALGHACLYYESWHRAAFGDDDWNNTDRIPVQYWNDYLVWFRKVTALPVRYMTKVTSIEWNGHYYTAHLSASDGTDMDTVRARFVVLATGIEGSGPWRVPPAVADNVQAAHYNLVCDDIDFAALQGKRIAVLGGGASAYDHAAVCMEHGARSVDIMFRRQSLHRVNPHHWTEFHGFLDHFGDLDDGLRLQIMRHILPANEPPPTATFKRATAWNEVNVLLGEDAASITDDGVHVIINTQDGPRHYDHVIVATGVRFDPATRPELAALLPHIASWRDVVGPSTDPVIDGLLDLPYLGKDMRYTGRTPEGDEIVRRVYNLTSSATLSHGPSGTSINGLRPAAERIARGICQQLFTENAGHYLDEIASFDTPELTVPWPPGASRLREVRIDDFVAGP